MFDSELPEAKHAIYVSVLEIEQVDGSSGSIKLKVFADDLEDAIQNHSGTRVDLLSTDCSQSSKVVDEYLEKHLEIAIDGQRISYYFVECELNDISLWLSFNFTSDASWSRIIVSADYLMELFPTQSNVVSVLKGEKKQMIRLQKDSSKQEIIF